MRGVEYALQSFVMKLPPYRWDGAPDASGLVYRKSQTTADLLPTTTVHAATTTVHAAWCPQLLENPETVTLRFIVDVATNQTFNNDREVLIVAVRSDGSPRDFPT